MILYAAAAIAAQARSEPVRVTPVLTTTRTAADQPIVLPRGPVEVRVATYAIAPGAKLPTHRHPTARYAYMLAGELTVTIDATGASHRYRSGDFIVEAIDRWHSAINGGAVTARLLVIDQAPQGQDNVVLRSDPSSVPPRR